MLNIKLKDKEKIKFEDLEVGTFFIWHTEDMWGNYLGMKIADCDNQEPKILDLAYDTGTYYSWDNRYHIDRVINRMNFNEV